MLVRAVIDPYCREASVTQGTSVKMVHQVNRWEMFGGPSEIELIDEGAVGAFRAACLEKPLAATTIEDTISDIALLVKFHCKADLAVGKRLKKCPRAKYVPRLDAVAQIYAVADQCEFPAKIKMPSGCFQWITAEKRADFMRCLLVLGVWTGLRVSDLLQLSWKTITDTTIGWQASKTSKMHLFPICPVVKVHLDAMRNWERPTVLGIGKSTAPYVREELDRLAAAAQTKKVTPKSFRQCAITSWGKVGNGECGRIIHGTGIPKVLESYYDFEEILRDNMHRFPWPEAMLPSDLRDIRVRRRAELAIILERLSAERLETVHSVALAFTA